ncbi:MAG: cation transporter [Bacteroidota bacterium]
MNQRTETVTIEGMTCGHCVMAVRQALSKIEGVVLQDVAIGSATISYDPDEVSAEAIDGAIEDAGFTVGARAEMPA